jgi:collagenase-like PrtC family protease
MLAVMGCPGRCWLSVSLFHAQGNDKRDTQEIYRVLWTPLVWEDPDTLHVGQVPMSDPGLLSDLEGTRGC